MLLAKHVLTGADDNTTVESLIEVASDYNYVEFGLLIGKGDFGKPKYPSRDWFARRSEAMAKSDQKVEWSLHVCDEWAGDIAHGIPSVFTECKDIVSGFNRMQLNIFREINDQSVDVEGMVAMLKEYGPDKQYIFQLTSFAAAYIVTAARAAGLDALGFFDPSAGRGISPANGNNCS
jgi:hypothetical protein